MDNTLYYGDNLDILRTYIPDESVDLVYLDPPFNSKGTYNLLYSDERGDAPASTQAFKDSWNWADAARTHEDEILSGNIPDNVRRALLAFGHLLGTSPMMAYLTMMTPRLLEMHRVLKGTGSLYLHCDPSASHYLKIILDTIFGPENFRNEIVWKRATAHSDSTTRFSHVTDTILFYARSKETVWNPQYQPHSEKYLHSHYRHRDEQGRVYRLDNIIRSASMGARPNLVYEYKGFTPPHGWRVEMPKLIERDAAGLIYWSRTGTPYLVRYLDEQKGEILSS